MQGFTEAQVQEMATRGAALDGTRPSDRWRLIEDADSPGRRWQGPARAEYGLQAS
jgi:hypothetical protein